MFSVRLVTADSYQAQPVPQLDPTFSEFRGSEIKHVPVIRIFGTTADGEKTCLHVHGVFPYLFVPYTGEEDPEILAYRLAAALDAAINVSLGSATSNTQHVYSIQRVSGIPFYGYHRKEHQFLKIYFYNPAMIKRAADLLQNGSVLNQSLQPHEAHINYILQFMMDYNIYGMSFVNLRSCKHRRVAQSLAQLSSSGQSVNSESNNIVYMPMEVERQSTCELEVDAVASDILNRLDIEKDLELNPGLAAIWEEERARRAQAGLSGGDSQLVNPKSPTRPPCHPTDNDAYQEQRLNRRLLMISQCDESTLSTTSHRSVAYAAETRDDQSLMNASCLPNISIQKTERVQRDKDESSGNVSFVGSPMNPMSQNFTADNSILGTEDMPLIDLLAQLARETENNDETVDADSMLGSQVSSILFNENENKNDSAEEDEDDVGDLNLTSLELDELGSIETEMNRFGRSSLTEQMITERKKDALSILAPYLSPCEISSSSAKSAKDEEEAIENEDSRSSQLPQYDGAGDVSPNLLNSDHEDSREIPNNAKDYERLPESNGMCEINAKSPGNFDQSVKFTSRAKANVSFDYDLSRNVDFFRNSSSSARDCTTKLISEDTTLANGTYLHSQWNGDVDYNGSVDLIVDTGNDLITDFADMRSSMGFGILLSSTDDNEKAESLGESNQDKGDEDDDGKDGNDGHENGDGRETLPLEAVLNGDPCFTESAELDKSDLTELRDQYVSLLDNALLPEVRDSSRIDSGDLEDSSSTFAVAHFETIEKTCPVSPGVASSRVALVTSRGSSSSLENIAPNVPRASSIASDEDGDDDLRIRKHTTPSNDTADYNCNVVATWEELQNFRIIDKTENDRAIISSKRRPRIGKYLPGPRSKRRLRRSSSLDRGQIVRESLEKTDTPTIKFCSQSELADKSRVDAEIVDRTDETLPRTFDITRLSHSTNEDTGLEDPDVQSTGVDVLLRSTIESDNVADARSILPGARYSTYPSLRFNDSLVEPTLADFLENPDDLREDPTETLSDVGADSLPLVSYYVPRRSLSHSEAEDRQHRHCFISKNNKLVQDQVFASDQFWIIQKRKRGKIHSSFRNLCTSHNCKLPFVFVRKLENDRKYAESAVEEISTIVQSLPRQDNAINATESIPFGILTSEKINESPQAGRVSRMRSKRETSPKTSPTIENIDSPNYDTAMRSNEILAKETNPIRRAHRRRGGVRTNRKPRNTRRHVHGSQFIKQCRKNARIDVESGEKSRRGRKKARARTKYKECSLPGIPGIVNEEAPVKRRRSRKVALSSNALDDGNSSKPIKSSPSQISLISNARRDQTEQEPHNVVKSPTNGLLPASYYIDIPPEKLRGQRIKTNVPINPRRRAPRDAGKDSLTLMDSSTNPKKFANTRQSHGRKIHSNSFLTSQTKLPETVTLGLMMQEARPPGIRKALQLLLQRRQSQKLECQNIKDEQTVKKPNDEKTRGPEIAARKETIVKSAVITDRPKVTEAPTSQKIDESENPTNTETSSCQNVTTSNADSKTPTDSISMVSVDSEICDPVEFDPGTTTLDIEFSVDDTATIFDADTTVDAITVETTSSEEFWGVVKITYDTDLYENAIKEANYFAGRNYSIDAVSNEIPTCLFEEDSNSVDKRLPKRMSDVGVGFTDDPDALSELSVDPRDMDVYDVESLTSTGSVSPLDETTDVTETSFEISDGDLSATEDVGIKSPRENSSSQEAANDVDISVDTNPEHDSSFEEESPSFEALSPQPRIVLTLAPALEEEFAVHSSFKSAESEIMRERTGLGRFHDETLRVSKNIEVTIDEEKTSIRKGVCDESSSTLQTSETVSFSDSSIGVHTSSGVIQSHQIHENSKLDSGNQIGEDCKLDSGNQIDENSKLESENQIEQSSKLETDNHIEEDSKLDSENQINKDSKLDSEKRNDEDSQRDSKIDQSFLESGAEHEIELEIPEVTITRGTTESLVDADIQQNSNDPMDEALEESLSSTGKNNPVLMINSRKIDLLEPSDQSSEHAGETEETNFLQTVVELGKPSIAAEKTLNSICVENGNYPISRDLPVISPRAIEFPTRAERRFDEARPVGLGKQNPGIIEERAKSPVEKEDEMLNCQLLVTAHDGADEQSVPDVEENATPKIAVDEQRDFSTRSFMESPAIVQRDEELLESNKNRFAESTCLESEDVGSNTLEQSCLPAASETEENLSEITQNREPSTFDKNDDVPQGRGDQSSSHKEDSLTSPLLENHRSSKDSVETEIEPNVKVWKSDEGSKTCEESSDALLNVDEQSNLSIEHSPIIEENEGKSDRQKEPDSSLPKPNESSLVISTENIPEESTMMSRSTVEIRKHHTNVDSPALSSIDSNVDSLVTKSVIEAGKVAQQFVNEKDTAKIQQNGAQQMSVEKETTAKIEEKVTWQIVREEESIVTVVQRGTQQISGREDTKTKLGKNSSQHLVNGEGTITKNAEIVQQVLAEEETSTEAEQSGIEKSQFLSKRETEKIRSEGKTEQTENNRTDETHVTSGGQVTASQDEKSKEFVDINKNETDPLLDSDQGFIEPQSMNPTSPDDHANDEAKAELECRPVSITLVNIDLSKIRSLTLKAHQKLDNANGKCLQAIPHRNEESDQPISTQRRGHSITPMTENPETMATTETKVSPCNEKVRRSVRIITKNTSVPERRSVRICAERTLKFSRGPLKNSMESTVECLKPESTSGESVLDSSISESSLTKNSSQTLQKDGSFSIDIRQICQPEVEVSPKMNKNPKSEIEAPSQEFALCQSKTSDSPELVLSEQTLVNGNATPSLTKPSRRVRSRKRAQSQEAASSPRIIDENTAPISDNPKRRRSQVNLQETLVDLESSKPLMLDEAVRRSADKTSPTVIDAHVAEFNSESEKNGGVDSNNPPIKRRRGRFCSRRKICRSKIRLLSETKIANNRDDLQNSKLIHVPPLEMLKNIPDLGKEDEPSLSEETVREVAIEPRIITRRGRLEKNTDIDKLLSADCISSLVQNSLGNANAGKSLAESTEKLDTPVVPRRRGRSGKLLETSTIRHSLQSHARTSKPVSKRTEESIDQKTAVVQKTNHHNVSSVTRSDFHQSESTQQRSTDAKQQNATITRKTGRSRTIRRKRNLVAKQTSENAPAKETSQEPVKLPEKIIKCEVESYLDVDIQDGSKTLSLYSTEPQESTLETRIVLEEVEATITSTPDNQSTSGDSSSIHKTVNNSCEGTIENVYPRKRRRSYQWGKKRRRLRKPKSSIKPLPQTGLPSESTCSTSGSTTEHDGSDPLTQRIIDETVDLNTVRVRQRRHGKQPSVILAVPESIINEKKDLLTLIQTDHAEISTNTIENNPPSLMNSLPPMDSTSPNRRAYFTRSTKRCQGSETSEPRPKKRCKRTEHDSPVPTHDIIQEASGSTLDLMPLSARLNQENNDAYEEKWSITESRMQHQRNGLQGILREHFQSESKKFIQLRGDKLDKPSETYVQLRTLRSTRSSRNSSRGTITYTQLKRPIILLKRLSMKALKRYGIAYRSRDRKFVKLFRKSIRDKEDEDDEEFQVPAYDGAADLSSSDEEDPDVTIAREEKRICAYVSSAKKSALAKCEDSAVTPKKRKPVITEEASSPAKKLQTDDAKPSDVTTPRKKSYRSSLGGTSTLKTPSGGNSRVYSPLKIIVTSPKVRKERLDTKSSPRRTEKHDGNSNYPSTTSSFIDSLATTSARKSSCLHDTVLRGRLLNTAKSSFRELGDKHATVDKTGSSAVGELDEIRCIDQTEQRIVDKLNIASECDESYVLRDPPLSTRLPDPKDVRKRLLFPDEINHDIETITELSNMEEHERPEIHASRKEPDRLGRIEDEGSMEVATNEQLPGTTMFEAVPGPSRRCDDSERRYEDGTEVHINDEDVEDDDICNITFTQYIESQKNKNEMSLSADYETNEMKERITIMPKFKPPNRQTVIDTMEKYGIPKYRNVEPFFSEAADVPKQKELAQKMLRVPGKSLDFLPAFVSSVAGVTGLARWRKMWLNEFHPSLAKSKEREVGLALVGSERIVITPLVKPPTYKEVQDWVRAREYLAKKKIIEEPKKKLTESKKLTQPGIGESLKLKQSELLEVPIVEDDEENDESNSSEVSVVDPSPERTLISNDLEKLRSTKNTKIVKKTLFKVEPADCKNSEVDNPGKSQKAMEKISLDSNGSADPSLLNVLEKSRLFRDQERSRHLGFSRGQIEFVSDSTRTNVTAENLRNVQALTRYQYLTLMCLEVHVATRGDLLPDAQYDPIAAIFYSVQSDVPPTSSIKPLEHGVIVLAEDERSKNKMNYTYASRIPWTVNFAGSEEALLNSLVTLITRTDPEIMIGWELETLSWGYVFQRASRLGMNLFKRVSRIPTTQYKWEFQALDIETLAEVKLPGRIVLDIWRLMRHEAALLSYTFESVMNHVLNERIPCPSWKTLTEWWNLGRSRSCRWRVVEHYSIRVLGIFRILDQLDIVGRTSELARLFGIQFYEVFSRGSQFRVESVMLRLAKPLNYIAVSPSSQQRASMRAMEALPLILEPESMLYSDPLIVLDFQSLYPSIIIAHNYCFSTCLGRIEHIGQPEPFEFGAYTLRVPKRTALKLQGKVNYAPCGVAYVKPEVRLGILPRMLTEILETRFMVKKAMKDHSKEDKTLQRALHSRQMGLKFLANVTYGYTAANFSGRMPCIEVGDSVISKSKETLERAIKLVESTPKWGARVVYGDTDSLFILAPGKSKDEAFVIGNEIADAVTASNPPPIKLKFEKVLYPAILQTKKRYCGYMYETQDQAKPTYLAKGIETVRRDGCPAVSKILEKTLKILFETKDVSLVKKYVSRQLDKVLRGKVSIQDLTFAKEFRGLKGYKAKACVPALELTRRLMKKDPRAVPRNSERVRYVIIAGAPNQALIHCVRTPWELIDDPGLRPNAIYYVTRVIIPPLNRCLNLMGVDVNEWYREMPHRQVLDNPVAQPSDKHKLTIFQYFGTIVCVACGQPSNKGICAKCLSRPADTLVAINEKLRLLDRTNNHVTTICQSCVGQADAADCASLDCPVLYRRAQARRELTQANQLREIIECGNNLEF